MSSRWRADPGTGWRPADQLGEVRDADAKLVWSLPMALRADWLPSGSTSLLAEMKVARRCLAEQSGRDPGTRRLVQMVTRDAAGIAGLDDQLGRLAADRPADLAVFERRTTPGRAWPTPTYRRCNWSSSAATSPTGPRGESRR